MGKLKFICPVRLLTHKRNRHCVEFDCRWWDAEFRECAIKLIAKAMTRGR